MVKGKYKYFLIFFILGIVTDALPGVNGEFSLINDKTVVDQSGRVIEIKKPFERIISLYGAHTENLFFMGLDKEIIGVTKNDRYPEKALKKKVFSYHDDPEKFLSAKPDLVLIRPMIDRGYAKLTARLENSGITVVSIQPGNVEEMYRYWICLGVLTGKEEIAEKMTASFKEAVETFSNHISSSVGKRKHVYFEAMHKNMKTFSSGSMADFVLTTAGGINIADDGSPSRGTNIAIYGKEKILSKADEIDVYLAQKGAMNHPTKALIKNEPGFSVIKAVKNDSVYIIDEQIVSRPTMRLLSGIHKTGVLLYPELSGTLWDNILAKAVNHE